MDAQIIKTLIPSFHLNINMKKFPFFCTEIPRIEMKVFKNINHNSRSSDIFGSRTHGDYMSTILNPGHFYEYKKRMKSQVPKSEKIQKKLNHNALNFNIHKSQIKANENESLRNTILPTNDQNILKNCKGDSLITINNQRNLNKTFVY